MTDVAAGTSVRSYTALDRKLVDDLTANVRGQVIVPSHPAFDEARSVWNGMIERRPALVVRPICTPDVITCVNWARAHGLRVAVKGGGHNIAGLGVCDDGLVIDMSLMRGVFVDAGRRVARTQAGCLLGDVDRETQLHGLAAVLGFVSNTGAAGLTLGGGFGYLSRKYGWASDNVVGMDVVLADGSLVRASERENADLFWALRGGGGNFGVVTGFEYTLYPLGPEIIAGAIAWRAEDAAEVFDMYARVMRDAPPELQVILGLRLAPPAPWLPADVHGKPIVALFVCYAGSVADGEKVCAPIKACGRPAGDIVTRRTYVSQQSIVDAANPKGRRYYWKSEYLRDVSGGVCEAGLEHLRRIPSPHSAILFAPLDGAVNRLPVDHSAVGNRDARGIVNFAAAWESPAADATNIEWTRAAWRDARRYSTGGVYVNFLAEDDAAERVQAAYGPNLARLSALKAKWDPTNFFRVNKNVAPGGGG